MKKVGIYKITSPSGKVYIGQSWDLETRLYRYTCNPEKHKTQVKLYNSFCKYGTINHTSEIVQELPFDITQEILDNYEIFYINQYKETGYKLLNIKEGGWGGKHSEESKRKMSISHTGKKLSTDHIEKISLANTGKKRTQAYKDLMSEKRTGFIQSEETKKKISEIKKEYFKNNDVYNKGKLLDQEGRKKLSDASTSKRPVFQYDLEGNFIKEYISIKEASLETGIKANHICRVCKEIRPTAGKFRWKYKINLEV